VAGAVRVDRAVLSQSWQRPPAGRGGGMLRIYFLQQWFNLSDPAVEEALYDSLAMRDFVGIDLGREPVPDETTVCRFRHLLETHDLGQQLFDEVQRHLTGLRVATGTIVDATIISAPSSTKNAKKARDPEMHQTKKGNQWYFGMKAHLGIDSRTKLIHAAVATPCRGQHGAARFVARERNPRVGRPRLIRLRTAPLRLRRAPPFFNADTAPHPRFYTRRSGPPHPSFGITVTLGPLHDDATIDETVAALARESGRWWNRGQQNPPGGAAAISSASRLCPN
jgi:hypothetical protein